MTEELVREFLRNVDSLSSGERAALKRSSGKLLDEADGNAFMAFYKALPGAVATGLEERWFFVACMRCLWKPDDNGSIVIEKAIAQYNLTKDSTGFEKRIMVLLDQNWTEDGVIVIKLCRIIKQLKNEGFILNLEPLIQDLCEWNYQSRKVQKKWARAYYNTNQSIVMKNEEESIC